MKLHPDLTPAQLVLARCQAFEKCDFGLIYDSYHPEAAFRRQFPDRDDYIQYGQSALKQDFNIRECRILKTEEEGQEARLIYYLDIVFQGNRHKSFELSFFRKTKDGWRYYMTQKLDRQEFQGDVEEIDWRDFEEVQDRLFF